MREKHRVDHRGLNEFNHIPRNCLLLSCNDTIQTGDIQRIHDEWYVEYPANGMLIGNYVGSGKWYRHSQLRGEKRNYVKLS